MATTAASKPGWEMARRLSTGEQGDADQLVQALEAQAEIWLRPYIARLQSGELQPRPKIINDALWGSIRLDSWEVAILDAPLMQRLRYLRQLGVAHWVYPSAGHSRLEHSLGVLHQMECLLSSIERTGRAGKTVVNDFTRKLLKTAALLHDCGHSVMSHVSEKLVQTLPGVEPLRRRLHLEFKPRKRPSPSEAFAATFVQSPAFRELLSLPIVGASFIRDTLEATRQIAGLILGGPVIPNAAFLTLLVNGAFDADKLDYMARDSLMAGVPCPVDVLRVIETVRVIEVPVDKLPPSYPSWAGLPDAQTLQVLTLTGSGARVLEELAMARNFLYEKVYFHHKIRALEVMVRRALNAVSPQSAGEWLELVDDELLVGANRSHFDPIRVRDLLKRALVLTPPSEGEDATAIVRQEQAWSRLMEETEQKRLLELIIKESIYVAKLIGTGEKALGRQAPEIDVPPIGKVGLDQNAFVGDNVEQFARADATLSGQRTVGGRHAARQTVYIFAPEGAVLPVFIAARNIIQRELGLEVRAEAYRATRLDPETIADAETRLASQGYFGKIVPPPTPAARIVSHKQQSLEAFLRASWSRIEQLATAFGQYQPFDGPALSPSAIADYIRQFETERLARCALLTLEAVDFKDRNFFAQALETHLRQRVAQGEVVGAVCPLGGTGDSSAFLTYLMNDVEEPLRRQVLPLELALDEDVLAAGSTIILWDDFCGQGGHTLTALQQWLGLPASKAHLSEQLVRPLSSARSSRLKQHSVRLAFALARREGIEDLRTYLRDNPAFNIEAVEPTGSLVGAKRLFDTDAIIPNAADRTEFQTFLAKRMRAALEHNKKRSENPWTDEKLESRLLGYGMESHLLVFPYNVPTVTLTALWVSGDGWVPLFRRRQKPGA